MTNIYILSLCLTVLLCCGKALAEGGADYVDPLIGTGRGGHAFPGATLPFGMAKAVADVTGENAAGYGSDGSKIRGFSHMHDSGTGGVSSLGNFPIFPLMGCPGDNLTACTFNEITRQVDQVPDSVEARPGYFALSLVTGIKAEMTVSNHTALYRFTFKPPQDDESTAPFSPVIVAELNDLPGSTVNANIYYNKETGRITGNSSFTPSFGTGRYRLSFCADFSGADIRDTAFWTADNKVGYQVKDIPNTFWPKGAFNRFHIPQDDNQINVRVGLSFKSIEQACQHAETEIQTFDFEKTLAAAEKAWDDKLDVIDVKYGGVSDELRRTFWSGIYRNFISPQDYTGENYLWGSEEPYYDSFYCIWDSFRAQHPLITIMDPHSQTQMIRGLIDIWRHERYLPDCRMSLSQGWTQGGSNADVVLADAYVKGLTTGINWDDGYAAVIQDAEVEAARWDLHGRGGLESWKTKGYIPINDVDNAGFGPHTRSVSRTVEYAYNDFCIAQMSKHRGNMTEYDKYMSRAGNWVNLYKEDQESTIDSVDTGFKGVLQPKNFDGTWNFQDALLCSPLLEPDSCYLTMTGHETYEGSAWLYTFFVPGDVALLIEKMGGRNGFVDRLDFLHESGILYMGDEQSFLTPFLYHYAGRPGLSARRIHTYIPSQFNDTILGIPGNDDSGAMGAFASFPMMGIFPNAGQNVYFIVPPFFEEVSIRNPQTGRTATIRNVNFDKKYKNIYIQSAKLDGNEYTKNWIDHGFFLDGGVLELILGSEESDWGTKEDDVPPSLSTTGPVNGTWDSSGPSRALRIASYSGLFGPSAAFDPMRLLFFALGMTVMLASCFTLYRECGSNLLKSRIRRREPTYRRLDEP